jgi:hypothetical protein
VKAVVRYGIGLVLAWAGASAASAQFLSVGGPFVPYQTPANYPTAMYNRANQPLSPYLNLFRGGIPAVDYYYGVRPGLQTGGYPRQQYPPNGPRPVLPAFLPATPPGGSRDIVPPGFEYASAPKETTLSPAGHAVTFTNPGGFSPGQASPRKGFTQPTTPTKKP